MVFRKFVSNWNEKPKVKMNKPVYWGFSILEISKTLMCEFWYDYIKPKYQNNAKLWYMYADSLLFRLNLRIFSRVLLMMLLNSLKHQSV